MRVYRERFSTPDGKRHLAPRWYLDFRDHRDIRRRMPAFTDKAASEQLGRTVARLVERGAVRLPPDLDLTRAVEALPEETREKLAEYGLIDRTRLAGSRPVADLVAQFDASLRARGRARTTLATLVPHVRNVLDGAGARFWSDLRADRVEAFLRARREAGWSIQTSNHALAAVRQFCRWAVASGLATEDPLRTLHKLNVATDRRRVRRALSAQEVGRLLAWTAAAPERHGMSGAERALLYRVAIETGVRRQELQCLRVGDFDTTPGRAVLRLRAETTKNRKAAAIPLREDLADALRGFLSARLPSEVAFHVPAHWRAAETLQADLAGAGVAIEDESGRVADFHALRHSFATLLASTGAAPRVAQALARHSDVRLTLGTYTHLGADDERAAIEALPAWPRPAPAPDAERATGTTGSAFTPPSTPPSGSDSRRPPEIRRDINRAARAPERGSVVRPAGFEPATVGSEDRSSSS